MPVVSVRIDDSTLWRIDAVGEDLAAALPGVVAQGKSRGAAIKAAIALGLAWMRSDPSAAIAALLNPDAVSPPAGDATAALALAARVTEAVEAYNAATASAVMGDAVRALDAFDTGSAPTDELQADADPDVRVDPVSEPEPKTGERTVADVLAKYDRRENDADCGPGGERRRYEEDVRPDLNKAIEDGRTTKTKIWQTVESKGVKVSRTSIANYLSDRFPPPAVLDALIEVRDGLLEEGSGT